MKLRKVGILALFFALSAPGSPTLADESPAPSAAPAQAGPRHHGKFGKGMKEVFDACAKANDIALPAKGTPLSAGDRSAIHACVQRFHDDMKACLSAAGITPPVPGQPRVKSPANEAAFKACDQRSLGLISAK